MVHELYETTAVREAVAEHFGRQVLRADGTVDRVAIAERVFADPDERRWLEGLLLPLLFERVHALARSRARAAITSLLVHEAPTLFEAGVEERYDAIVTITAPAELREQRRPGAARGWPTRSPRPRRSPAATSCTSTTATWRSSMRSCDR